MSSTQNPLALLLQTSSIVKNDELAECVRLSKLASFLDTQVRPRFTHQLATADDTVKAKCILVTIKILEKLAEESWQAALNEASLLRESSTSPKFPVVAAPSAGLTIAE